jgi:predicted DCC family thiol-disulfide oxidoreductase YuxK
MAAPSPPPVILFDGECGFCSRWVAFVMRHDRGLFRFAPRQSDAAERLLRPLGVRPDELGSVALLDGGRLRTHSDAVLSVVARLGFPWRLAACLAIIPRPARDFGYALVARNRHRLSRRGARCPAPDSETDGRFLR